MPSARALLVISAAKSSSVPEMASATTTAASFADLVTKPRIASSTSRFCPGRRPSLVGACTDARSDTGIELLSFILPDSRRSNSR